MGLIWDRVKRLVAANVRELIEAAKDPEVELLEFVANIEASYGEIKAEMVDASNAASQSERHLDETRQEAQRWERKARAAVRTGEDDLAKEALRRKGRTEALAAHIHLELKEQLQLADSLEKTLHDLQRKLEEAQGQRDVLLARSQRASVAQRVADTLKSKILWRGDAMAERLSEEILEKKSRMEAYQDLHGSELETELRRLAPPDNLDGELERLKKSISKDKRS
jgi:phage shock protein A